MCRATERTHAASGSTTSIAAAAHAAGPSSLRRAVAAIATRAPSRNSEVHPRYEPAAAGADADGPSLQPARSLRAPSGAGQDQVLGGQQRCEASVDGGGAFHPGGARPTRLTRRLVLKIQMAPAMRWVPAEADRQREHRRHQSGQSGW